MDPTIVQALLRGTTVSPSELTSRDWQKFICRLVDVIRPLANRMRLPLSTDEHIDNLERRAGTPLMRRLHRAGRPMDGRFRILILGESSTDAYLYTALAFGDDGELRVISANWGEKVIAMESIAVQPLYESVTRSGEYIQEVFDAAPIDKNGCNTLGLQVCQSLLGLIIENAESKARQAKRFEQAASDVAHMISVLSL